ncbi:cryptochrome/photolyase family protein [Sinomicrobium sp. M5D2P9]
MNKINVFWFRRDLRLHDNSGLHHALQSDRNVLPVFIFDTEILKQFTDKKDRRVHYIHQVLEHINSELQKNGSSLLTFFGTPQEAFEKLSEQYDIERVFCNRDYEPAALKRDKNIHELLKQKNIAFQDYKDQVIFEKNEVVKKDGDPYTVYTPYSKTWKNLLKETDYEAFDIKKDNFLPGKNNKFHTLKEIGYEKTNITFSVPELNPSVIDTYDKYRDYPAMEHTTNLGKDLRFGTISIRQCVRFALQHNKTWLDELIWREFFMQILYHFPEVVNRCFKEKYERIKWRNNEEEFQRWCKGKTGYPIVDAGMRQLNQTGSMHNRVRMITASFLTKHLLIDWRWGEAYFAQKLLDYDMAANNGNWQWAAGCGCDAAPYFRVFSPEAQTKKFDKDLKYIRKWYPDYDSDLSNLPIVEHSFARKRALEAYRKGLHEKD